ncbi:MAG TPA: hypothetical protein VE954_12460 [Oligoflexus sp.]|uniref:hypothetical protein n=1 Tax=Oligoflexus sp. TaxID=1971216 RepID=UPI002D7081AC|nr:hypothetical protein [Oligoflexus sp.]HYX33920.1 hypothetical protein [Oligoflexus sp.]
MTFYSKLLLAPTSTALVALGLIGCGQIKPTHDIQNASALSSTAGDFDPRLGEAYDQIADTHLGSTCLKFTSDLSTTAAAGAAVEYIPPKIGELVISQNASFDDLSDALSGGGELNLNLDAFKGSGSVQFANDMQSDTYSSTFSVFFNVESGEYALKQQEGLAVLNSLGDAAKATLDPTQKRAKCGTEFVSRKKLAANFVAVLKFEFANKGQRDNFEGNVKFESSVIGGNVAFNSAVSKANADAKISLKVRQVGGDATKLSTLAVQDIANCSTKNREACSKSIAAIFTYLNTFPDQFIDPTTKQPLPERFATVANDYRSYDSVDAGWTSAPISPAQAAKLALDRRAFGEKMNDEISNYNRASALLQSGMSLTVQDLSDIRKIQDIIRNRVKVYAKAAQSCYGSTWETCDAAVTAADTVILKDPELVYDATKLVVIPTDIMGWCTKINQWGTIKKEATLGDAVANTILSTNELYTLVKMYDVLKPKNKTLSLDPSEKGETFWPVGAVDCGATVIATRDATADKVVMSQMRIDNIDPIASLTYTRSIDLSQNFIADALPLAKMRFLEVLNLSKNKIASIDGLATTYVTSLNLSENSLSSSTALNKGTADKVLSQLSGIPTLEKLDLSGNKFLTNLKTLSNLPALSEINLVGTGLTRDEAAKFLDRAAVDFPSLVAATFSSSPKLKCVDLLSRYSFVTCL